MARLLSLQRCRQVVMLTTLSIFVFYLGYRWNFTFNTDYPLVSGVFFLAECFGFFSLSLFFFQIWQPRKRARPPPASPGLSVDVLIPTINEDLSLLRKTLTAAVAIKYPHKTYVLDDGKREDVQKLAQELGCIYLKRSDNKDAKAGNLNHGLQQSSGDYIVVFDADYAASPDFLDKTLGYFRDMPQLAYVQTPQHYYNHDSFVFEVNQKKRQCASELDLFYDLCMPGLDAWGAAYFVGTGAVFRRCALDSIGGFARGSITEDIVTAVKLFAQGWTSVYHAENLSHGLAVDDVCSYRKQKMRWCEGNVKGLLFDNPFYSSGLTWTQKIAFFGILLNWFSGFFQLFLYVTPPLILLSGTSPIVKCTPEFLGLLAFFLLSLHFGMLFASRGLAHTVFSHKESMRATLWVVQGAMLALFYPSSRFQVSGKNRKNTPVLFLLPQIVLIALSLAGTVFGAYKLFLGPEDPLGLFVGIAWCLINACLAYIVLDKLVDRPAHRGVFRVEEWLPVEVKGHRGCSLNLNETGALLLLDKEPADTFFVTLYLGNRVEKVQAVKRFVGAPRYGKKSIGVEFLGLDQKTKDRLAAFCLTVGVANYFHSFGRKSLTPFWKQTRQSERKYTPKHIKVESLRIDEIRVVTQDMSTHGLSFRCSHLLLGPLTITDGASTLTGQIRRRVQIAGSGWYQYGIELYTPEPCGSNS